MDNISRLKEDLKDKKVKFGIKEAIKLGNKNMLERIYITKSMGSDKIENLKKVLAGKVEIVELKNDRESLKEFCKKDFNISVISVLKEENKKQE